MCVAEAGGHAPFPRPKIRVRGAPHGSYADAELGAETELSIAHEKLERLKALKR